MTAAYPLSWPSWRPRRKPNQQRLGQFKTKGRGNGLQPLTVAEAFDRLEDQLSRLGAKQWVISTNVQLTLSGRARSSQAQPADVGVAVYFMLGGRQKCMPCDTFSEVSQNLAGIAAHIEALRSIDRYGVVTVEEAFSGFDALPPPSSGKRHWTAVLGLKGTATAAEIEAAYRALAKIRHPDAGGSQQAMAELNAARDEAMKENGNV
jgi:hypothetical protein